MNSISFPLIVVGNKLVFQAFKDIQAHDQVHFWESNQAALDNFPQFTTQARSLPVAIIDAASHDLPTSQLLSQIRKDPQLRSMVIFVLGNDLPEFEFQKIQQQNIAGFIKKPEIAEGYADIADVLMKFWEICILA